MKSYAIKHNDPKQLLNPHDAAWLPLTPTKINLEATPAAMQPTDYIRTKWKDKKFGQTGSVGVAVCHTDDTLFFRMEWEDKQKDDVISDNDSFPDGVAIMLPVVKGAPMLTMGMEGKPVEIWYWRADDEPGKARQMIAQGWGSTNNFKDSEVSAKGTWKDGRWTVVISRSLVSQHAGDNATIEIGKQTEFGVAVWAGSNSERAGLKAFSGNWKTLEINLR